MGSEYETLIICTKVFWLFAVRFWWQYINWGWNCSPKQKHLTSYFSDVHWLQQLVYIAHILKKFTEFNLSLQASSINVLTQQSSCCKVKIYFLVPMFATE